MKDKNSLLLGLKISLVVGSVLNLINQGEMLWGSGGDVNIAKLLLTYVVPFCVSWYSSVGTKRYCNHKEQQREIEQEQQRQQLTSYLNQIAQKTYSPISTNHVEAGEDKSDLLEQDHADHEIISSLNKLHATMQLADAENEKRNWIADGLTKFAAMLRSSHDEESDWDTLLSAVVKYVGANQAGLFVSDEEGETPHLTLCACFAFSKKKYLTKTIAPGEGLAGQCFLEGEAIYLKEVPEQYVNIRSGLGDAPPREVILIPLKYNNQIAGVLELAAFGSFEEQTIEFLENLGESIAAHIVASQQTIKNIKLLEESRKQMKLLTENEEEMRQNMEELTAIQEDMGRKETELQKALEQLEKQSVEQQLDQVMSFLTHTLDGNARELEFLAEVPPIQGIFRALENQGYDKKETSHFGEWTKRLKTIFSSLLKSKNIYQQVGFCSPAGACYVGVRLENEKIFECEDLQRQLLPADSIMEIAAMGDSAIYHSRCQENHLGETYFRSVRPVLYEGQIAGYVFVDFIGKELADIIRAREVNGNYYQLIDEQHRRLYGNSLTHQLTGIERTFTLNELMKYTLTLQHHRKTKEYAEYA